MASIKVHPGRGATIRLRVKEPPAWGLRFFLAKQCLRVCGWLLGAANVEIVRD